MFFQGHFTPKLGFSCLGLLTAAATTPRDGIVRRRSSSSMACMPLGRYTVDSCDGTTIQNSGSSGRSRADATRTRRLEVAQRPLLSECNGDWYPSPSRKASPQPSSADGHGRLELCLRELSDFASICIRDVSETLEGMPQRPSKTFVTALQSRASSQID